MTAPIENMQEPLNLVSGNSLTLAGGNISVTGNVTATGNITASSGNIAATAGTITAGSDITSGQHILATGSAPTAAAGAGAGSSPPSPVVTTGSNDARGNITWGTGTSSAAGAQVAVTFANAYGATPRVMANPRNSATRALGLYVSATSTTGFTLSCGSNPTDSQANTVYSFDYIVIG